MLRKGLAPLEGFIPKSRTALPWVWKNDKEGQQTINVPHKVKDQSSHLRRVGLRGPHQQKSWTSHWGEWPRESRDEQKFDTAKAQVLLVSQENGRRVQSPSSWERPPPRTYVAKGKGIEGVGRG